MASGERIELDLYRHVLVIQVGSFLRIWICFTLVTPVLTRSGPRIDRQRYYDAQSSPSLISVPT